MLGDLQTESRATGGNRAAYVIIAVLALGLMLGACAGTTQDTAAPKARAAGSTPKLARSLSDLPAYERIEPRRIEAPEGYTHTWSGMRLPSIAGELGLAQIIQFDAAETDIGAEYRVRTEKGPVLVTVYIYTTNPSALDSEQAVEANCAAEFAAVKQSLRQRFPSAELVAEPRLPQARLTGQRLGYGAIYDFVGDVLGKTMPTRSEAYLFCGVDRLWHVKYRVSYPQDLDAAAMIAALMAATPVVPR